jgi:4-aminobutyrate aminotransferase-like enzyme/Ser/Thr protein kinase RdoA (MazF antagonist)
LLALRTSPPVFTEAQVERIARDTYGLGVSVRSLPGERDRNFHLHNSADRRDFVLKILDFNSSPEATECQLRVLEHLAEQDPSLPVPRVHPTVLGGEMGTVAGREGSYATVLIGYLPGELLAGRSPDAPLLENLGHTLARLDVALRGFFHPGLGQRLAWDARRLPELVEHAAAVESPDLRRSVLNAAAALEERLPALRSLPSQAIHGDCHPHNVLVDPGSGRISGILDFGDMLHAPRVLECAVALAELLAEERMPLEMLPSLLTGYARRTPLEPAELALLYDLILGRHAATILVHAWRARHDAEGARRLDASIAPTARSMARLQENGREASTARWRRALDEAAARAGYEAAGRALDQAAGRAGDEAVRPAVEPVPLARRRRLLGAGAELFYERPLQLTRGSGVWLYDAQGLAYLDVYNNVPHVGHAHPDVVAAIQRQTALLATHTRYLHGAILDYAERLTATLPAHLDACMFVNSGSEANDLAWRLAKFATGRSAGIVMEHAYHGITDAAAALTPSTGQPRDARVVTLSTPPAGLARDDELPREALEAAQRDVDRAVAVLAERGYAPAAFFIDTAITSSGIFDPPPGWSAGISARLRAAGALIVADEVQYGLARSGSHFWGFERRGLEPDIVTLGKPVANGYPMGVVVARRELIEAFQRQYGFFSTFGGNAVAAAAALAVLEVLDRERLQANAAATGRYLQERLRALASRRPGFGAVRGTGLLLGLEVNESAAGTPRQGAKRIINRLAAEAHVLIGYEGPEASVLKLRPPLPFLPEHADRLVAALEEAAGSLDEGAPQSPPEPGA